MEDGASVSGLNHRLGTLSFTPPPPAASGAPPWGGIEKPDVWVFGLWETPPWCLFCCICCMSLSEGCDTLGEVAEDDHGGVLLSPSEEGAAAARAGATTATGLERASGMNEESLVARPALSGEFSWRSFALADAGSFVLLCSVWMSRSEAGPLVIFTPPQAGPSGFGVAGTEGAGRLGFGVSSRAPLRNSDRPPFLFFFFDGVG